MTAPPAPVSPHDAAFDAVLADARGDGRAFLAAAFDYVARRTPFFNADDASRQLARLLRDVRLEHGQGPPAATAGAAKPAAAAKVAAPAAPSVPPPPPLFESTTVTEVTDNDPTSAADAPPADDGGSASGDDDAEDGAAPASTALPPNAGNGADLPTYSWTQTLAEVVVCVPLPPGTRAAACAVTITRTHLTAGLNSAPAPILDGDLDGTVVPDDCFWSVGDGGRMLEITLTKAEGMRWWARVVEGDPPIDVTKVEPENSQLTDLDAETRATVEKMMWDQRQKALGRPTSEEAAKLAAIEKFKAMHPEMDFSGAKID